MKMNYNLVVVLIFVLVLVVYLTKLPLRNLGAFGLFLEKVFKSWPLSKYIEYLIKKVDWEIIGIIDGVPDSISLEE